MKILIAPDKFKGSLSGQEVGEAIARGIHQYDPTISVEILPLADGGEGSLAILAQRMSLSQVVVPVSDPLGRPIQASYYYAAEQAYVEMAHASGLGLLEPSSRNPLKTSSFGTGQLIKNAVQKGAREINLFLGGSATNDGGMGIASALGYQFLDQAGAVLVPSGQNLSRIHEIVAPEEFLLPPFRIRCLVDVQNPLLGPNGATQVYSPQKGATPEMMPVLEQGLRHFAAVVQKYRQVDITSIAGGGAAGGIPAGLVGLFDASIESGIDYMLKWTGFEKQLRQADLVISGEGKLDHQSVEGKVIQGVISLADQWSKDSLLIVGQSTLHKSELNSPGLLAIKAIMDEAVSADDAMENAAEYLTGLAYDFFRQYP